MFLLFLFFCADGVRRSGGMGKREMFGYGCYSGSFEGEEWGQERDCCWLCVCSFFGFVIWFGEFYLAIVSRVIH